MINIGDILLKNTKTFILVAASLIIIIEKNLDAFYRIKNKIKLNNEISHIDHLIRIFNGMMFTNGLFITEIYRSKKSLTESENFNKKLAIDFEKKLDDFSRRFDKHAPYVRDLGTDLVVLFKQAISLRRSIYTEYYSNHNKTIISDKKLEEVRFEMSRGIDEIKWHLYNIEKRLSEK